MSLMTDANAVDPFFDTDEFAEAATYTVSGGSPVSINALFTAAGSTIVVGGEEVITTQPLAFCKTSDVSAAGHGDKLVINSVTYYVTEHIPDGTGITKLLLSEDAT